LTVADPVLVCRIDGVRIPCSYDVSADPIILDLDLSS
jgi:hypothetical protein